MHGLNVAGAAETAQELISMIVAQCLPDAGPLLYARGQDVSTDIAGALEQSGFSVRQTVVYRALPAHSFSETLRTKLLAGEIAGVLFFSKRTAATYASLAVREDKQSPHQTMRAICMSEAVADEARALPWHAVHIAAHPGAEHMIKCAEEFFR